MKTDGENSLSSEPDIVLGFIACAKNVLKNISQAQISEIETLIRSTYGGQKIRVPKRRRHMTKDERSRLMEDALSSVSDQHLTEQYKITQRSLYRQIKRGITDRGKL